MGTETQRIARPAEPRYRSYGEVIQILTREAVRRVKLTKYQPEPKLEVITQKMRALAVRLMDLRRRVKRIERRLAADHKAQVDDDGSLRLTWEERNRLKNIPSSKYEARIDQINKLRIQATLDTIDMTPKQVKAYLVNLERVLAAI